MKKLKVFVSLMLIICLIMQCGAVFIAEDEAAETKRMYLSDMTPIYTSLGWGTLTTDTGFSSTTVSLIVKGEQKYFYKSVAAHATSTVIYYLGEDCEYSRFDTYMGIDYVQAGKGFASFAMYVSADNESWTTVLEPVTHTSAQEALHVNIALEGVHYLKFVFDSCGTNNYDHTVLGGAVLYSGDLEAIDTEPLLKPVSYFDGLFEGLSYDEIASEHRLDLLRRTLVEKAGYESLHYGLLSGTKEAERRNMLEWLWNDEEALEEFLVGGEPDGGNYTKALAVLSDLYAAYGSDLNDATLLTCCTDKTRTRGKLYRTMFFSLALTNDNGVYPWLYNTVKIDPVDRYARFKAVFLDPVNTLRGEVFENLCVEEMRYIMGNRIWNDEIGWLNAYARQHPRNSSAYYTGYPGIYSPHHHLRYGKDWHYESYGFYDEANFPQYDAKYQLTNYGVGFSKVPKLWMVFGGSHICWGISYVGTNFASAFGVPSHYVLQPGHAAFFIYDVNADGEGVWGIDNNIFGWTQTRMCETVGNGNRRMLCNWGTYGNSYTSEWSGSYIMLSQHALNNYDTYKEATVMWFLYSYAKTKGEEKELCNKVLDIMPYHLDAWRYLAALTEAEKNPVNNYKLAERITAEMYKFPQPMHDLLTILTISNTNIGTEEAKTQNARIANLEKKALQTACGLTSSNCDLAQPDVAVTMANSLLGSSSSALATFSFDGENAGKLVFGSQYSGVRFCYSLDGGNEWSETYTTSSSEMTYTFTPEELADITATTDIRIWLEGWVSDNDNKPTAEDAFLIDILPGTAVSGIELNDNEDRFMGTITNLEFSYDGENWKPLTSDTLFEGDVTVKLRRKANSIYLTGDVTEYKFTDNNTETRSYIKINRLTYVTCSSEETSHNDYAKYVIDGLNSTRWHTYWNGTDKDKYVVIKLDKPTNICGVNYTPDVGNGLVYSCRVYVSLDGVSWALAGTASGWGHDASVKKMTFSPIYGQYIKFQAVDTSAGFANAKSIEFFEDTTFANKIPVGIRLVTPPTKTEYIPCEKLDLAGTSVELVYSDNTKTVLPYQLLSSDTDVLTATGSHRVYLSYGDFAPVSFTVTVAEGEFNPIALKIATMPSKTVYYSGDEFEDTGLSVTATDGTRSVYILHGEYTVTADTDTVGTGKFTVSYNGLTAQGDITVKKAVSDIVVTHDPDITEYQLGQSIDRTGLEVTVNYADGSSAVLEYGDYIILNSETVADNPGVTDLIIALADKQSLRTTVKLLIYPYFTVNGIRYELSDDNSYGCYVKAVECSDDYIAIPETVNLGSRKLTVEGVATDAFKSCSGLTAVSVPSTVKHIESNAFTGCEGLQKVYLTGFGGFEELNAESDAFDTDTELVLFAATEELTEELAQKEFAQNLEVSDISTLITGIKAYAPEKTVYDRGDEPRFDDLQVTALLKNGYEVPLNSDVYVVSEADFSSSGEKIITVKLNDSEYEDTFTVTVSDSVLKITCHPVSAVYYSRELPVTPLSVEAVSSGGNDILTYQWFRSPDGTVDTERDILNGETSRTFIPEETGYYYVRVGIEGTETSILSMVCEIDRDDYTAIVGTKGYYSVAGAVAACPDGGTVSVITDSEINTLITVTKNVIIRGNDHILKRSAGFTDSFFNVTGGSLNIEGLILDGGAVWTGTVNETLQRGTVNDGITAKNAVVRVVNSATLILGAGSVIRNNDNTSTVTTPPFGSGVYGGNSAKIIINGCEFRDNYSYFFGSAIYHRDNSSLVFNSGIVHGGSGSSQWNTTAICTDNTATAVINGGTFCHNLGVAKGGVVWVSNGSFTVNGGSFTDNGASAGAGIYVNGSARVTLNSVEAMDEIYLTSGKVIYVGGDLGDTVIPVRTESGAAATAAVNFTSSDLSYQAGNFTVNGVTPVLKDGKLVLPCENHTEVVIPAVNPTCTETGLTEGCYCSVCGYVIREQRVIAATGHEYGEWIQFGGTETESGFRIHRCAECGESEFEYIPCPITEIAETSISKGFVIEKIDKTVSGEVVIPASVDGYDVVTVNAFAFMGCDKITSVVLPNTLTSLSGEIFNGCTSLTDVTLSENTEIIGCAAFECCESLTQIILPDKVSAISTGAFGGCIRLESITFSANVVSISDYAFLGCDSLKTVYFKGTQAQWDTITIGDGNEALLNCEIVFVS